MSKIDEIRAEMVAAMKNGDKARKGVLSLLLSALKAKWVDKHADLTEEEENTVIQKEIRQTRETMEAAPKDRTDIIEECRYALSVLEPFAPSMMSEEEIKSVLDGVLAKLGISEPTAKDRGRIMKAFMPEVKGRADGSTVSRIVAERCK